ncbi:TetR/AcrR family transcriptional regulator [Nocardioides albus]|uniref:AcrR family transcriptional regulator n=1 Tax=Nocardioides albus TaxID=1841 RepID=A0A7W5F853_9ACTN|nr:TetR/AcrR family transcriptional regulator [Nocardioides albus]MBB3088542.1 AcrR family transcriptional regulator [Nocardioides albus]GGU17023.1 putative transcriptional regulator, TetR family protein [Nocardioides albus]
MDAAARLFVDRSFAGTSTREIAEAVGIRQASLYYHFANKDEILGELLEMTIRPALDSLDDLDPIESPESRLYRLALVDARALAGLMHNIGLLPRLPDIAHTPEAKAYGAARRDLLQTYSTLAISCASEAVVATVDRSQLGGIVMELVESVIGTRAESNVVSERELQNVAAACLRVCGVSNEAIEAARTAARELAA